MTSKRDYAFRLVLFAALTLVGFYSVRAQTEAEIASAEYGSISDLVGLSKAFIFTTSIDSRQRIAKGLAKDSKLTVVDRREDADFTLYFKIWSDESLATGTTISTRYGSLVAAKTVSGKDEPRLRICWNTQESARMRWHDHPAESATREFLKVLKKAREAQQPEKKR